MKKIRFAICAVLCIIMTASVISADESHQLTIDYEDENKTVIFDSVQSGEEEKYRRIADYLVYGPDEYAASPASLCWLFGHDLTTTTSEVVTHKAKSLAPRCLKEKHRIETCSKCDYVNDEVTSSSYIYCHPED